MESVTRFFAAPSAHFFLFGPRGTGKSTWLRQNLPGALWLDLLDPEELRHFSARPERLRELLAGNPLAQTVVIDEVQRLPELLSVVHQVMEERPGAVRFVLTGSSSRKLKRTGVDLLAGRALLRRMHPFLAGEVGGDFRLDLALQAGMVPLVWGAADAGSVNALSLRNDRLKSYASLYIQEEVKAEGLVRSLGDFSRFLEAITFSQAATLNLAEVARECEVNRKTAEGYLSILEDLLLCFQVPIFTRRARRQLVAHPKFFFFDVGVFRALRPRGPLDSDSEIGGAALETLVAQHLRAWNELGGAEHSLGYWRTRSGLEVDLVVYGPLGLWAVEVKHSATIQPKDLRGLRAFREDYPEASPMLLYRGSRIVAIDDILVIPVETFLLQLFPGKAIWSNPSP